MQTEGKETMRDFEKVIRPGTIAGYGRRGEARQVSVYCKAEYRDGRLSITGVEGPLSNGDAIGGCGQIVMSLREPDGLKGFKPAEGWTRASFAAFLEIWDEWHLNEMRPHDSAMKRDGWREIAATPMLGYKFSLASEAWQERREAEKAALAALQAGESFQPTPRQTEIAAKALSYIAWVREGEAEPQPLPDYARERSIHGNGIKPAERKTLGWLKESEHPDGLLGRKHPESGNAYGGSWYREAVPDSVLEAIKALPDTDKTPAWV